MSNLTQNAIKTSFLKLLNERPLSKITVKDIVSDCGINRNSFYYHYEDIPSLIEEIVKSESDRIIRLYPVISTFEECVTVAAEFAQQNKKSVYHIYNSVNRDIFENHLWDMCRYVVTNYINTAFGGYRISEKDKEIIIRFYKCEIFGQTLGWLESGMKDNLSEINHRLCELRKGMMEELFRRCEKNYQNN